MRDIIPYQHVSCQNWIMAVCLLLVSGLVAKCTVKKVKYVTKCYQHDNMGGVRIGS